MMTSLLNLVTIYLASSVLAAVDTVPGQCIYMNDAMLYYCHMVRHYLND